MNDDPMWMPLEMVAARQLEEEVWLDTLLDKAYAAMEARRREEEERAWEQHDAWKDQRQEGTAAHA